VGVACPNTVTGETVGSILGFLRRLLPRLKGIDPLHPSELHRIVPLPTRHPAALSGIDCALHDLWGRLEGVPLSRLIGSPRESMATSVTVGITDTEAAVSRSLRWVEAGFSALKLKVGLDIEGDIGRVRRVREAVGEGIAIRVDCNQGYSVREALRLVSELDELEIELVEQPVAADDIEGLAAVCRGSPIPIMADESVRGAEDARAVGEAGLSLINLKLAKCGGILPALEISEVCGQMGMGIMVGCMCECQASIAAGLHLALSQPTVRYADLDSFLSLRNDPTRGVEVREGRLFPRPLPGLGIEMIDG